MDTVRAPRRGLDDTLEPMNSNAMIFEHMIQKARSLGLGKYLDARNGAPLRLATMCSGTESPVYALRLFRDALRRLASGNGPLEFKHLFSAEIVPFKQAFIERNFGPPTLFRDIQSLEAAEQGETAYGAMAAIPACGEVEMLLAGFACVDFSNLNTERKDLNVDWLEGSSVGEMESTGLKPSSSKRRPSGDGSLDAELAKVKQDGGESSVTFRAIAIFARDRRPPIILLENIKYAPWGTIRQVFEGLGYGVGFVGVDTKRYYLPHTRQRGYMACFDGQRWGGAKGLAESWVRLMHLFERPASSPVEDFLLPEASPALQGALSSYVRDAEDDDAISCEVSWTQCRNRHQRVRAREGLGLKTPYTNSLSGRSMMPTYGLMRWARVQPDRVKDMLDMLKLYNASESTDFEFKARYPDLSQNVDRMMKSATTGITGCLTPSGQPFSSLVGRPITGLESLALQGLSPDHLHLTRESQRELQDLAGNAMSSTVIGAAMLSAMIAVGDELLPRPAPSTSASSSSPSSSPSSPADPSEPDLISPTPIMDSSAESLPGDDNTEMMWHIPTKTSSESVAMLCELAASTVQLCPCEGQEGTANATMFICSDCGATACEECKGIPQHSYVRKAHRLERQDPRDFIVALQQQLPIRIRLSFGVRHLWASTSRRLEIARHADQLSASRKQANLARSLNTFFSHVQATSGQDVQLISIRRAKHWRVVYEGPKVRIELTIREAAFQWALFVKADISLPVNSPTRAMLQRPVANMTVTATASEDVLSGQWQLSLPLRYQESMGVRSPKLQNDSWKKELGLNNPGDPKIRSRRHIAPLGSAAHQFRALAGMYELLPKCGTANRALHIRRTPASTDIMFFFFDPDPYADDVENDEFVFSQNSSRLQKGQSRRIVARVGDRLPPKLTNNNGARDAAKSSRIREAETRKWRPNLTERSSFNCIVDSFEVRADLLMTEASNEDLDIQFPWGDVHDFNFTALTPRKCGEACFKMIQSHVPWVQAGQIEWSPSGTFEISEKNDRVVRAGLKWLTLSLQKLVDPPIAWLRMLNSFFDICRDCAPTKPTVKWVKGPLDRVRGKRKVQETGLAYRIFPREDPEEACVFEKTVKKRPSPFRLKFTRTQEPGKEDVISLGVGFNIQALAHRAAGTLTSLSTQGQGSNIEVFWRISPSIDEANASSRPGSFKLRNNKLDPAFNFKFSARDPSTDRCYRLRPDQARSLSWMLSRDDAHCEPFYEEIVEESVCTNLEWKLEARAIRSNCARGGIVADEVGFGKTITTLALIKQTLPDARKEAGDYHTVADATEKEADCPEEEADVEKDAPEKEADTTDSHFIPLRATLIVTPHSLTPQWKDEIQKFWPSCRLFHINSPRMLQQATIRLFQDADIVLVSTRMFSNPQYEERLATLAALPSVPVLKGSYEHNAWYAEAVGRLKDSAASLRKDPEGFADKLRQATRKYHEESAAQLQESKRFRGKAFQRHQDTINAQATEKSSSDMPYLDQPVEGLEKLGQGYAELRHPVFHLFQFHRKVIDEHTYVDEITSKALGFIKSRVTWILSATPALRDVYDVDRLMSFIGARVGIDDDSPGFITEDNAARLRNNRTDSQKFQACQESRSLGWHKFRQQQAQNALDHFARQNPAELPTTIEKEERMEPITLNEVHRILQLEHESLISSEATKLVKRRAGDPCTVLIDKTLAKLLESSSGSRSVAIAKCSTVSLLLDESDTKETSKEQGGKPAENDDEDEDDESDTDEEVDPGADALLPSPVEAMAIHDPVKDREEDCLSLKRQIAAALDNLVANRHLWSQEVTEGVMLWRCFVQDGSYGDPSVTAMLLNLLLDHEEVLDHWEDESSQSGCNKRTAATDIRPSKRQKTDSSTSPMTPKDLRKIMDLLNPLTLALVKGVRSARYCHNAQRSMSALDSDPDANGQLPAIETNCACRRRNVNEAQLCRECGHVVCSECRASQNDPLSCVVKQCSGRWLESNVILPLDLGLSTAPVGQQPASKVDSIVSLIQGQPEGKQSLLFVQYADFCKTLCAAMMNAGIKFDLVKSVHTAPTIMDRFKKLSVNDPAWVQVLMMDPFQSTAAGHNLPNVNQIIFVAPLLTDSKQEWNALYTQSIGRACRFGQKDKVMVHHITALGTADVNIVEARSGAKLVIDGDELKTTKQPVQGSLDLASRICKDTLVLRDV